MTPAARIVLSLLLLVTLGCGDVPAAKKKARSTSKPAVVTPQKRPKPAPIVDDAPTLFPIGNHQQQFGAPLENPAAADSIAPYAPDDPLSFIAPSDFIVIHINGAVLSKSPFFSALQPEQTGPARFVVETLKLDVQKWESLWVSVGPPVEAGGSPSVLRYTTFRSVDQRQSKLGELRQPENARAPVEQVTVNDKHYERFTDRFGEALAFFPLGERGLLEGSEQSVRAAVESRGRPSSTRLAELIRPQLGKGPVIVAIQPSDNRALAQAMVEEMTLGIGFTALTALPRVTNQGTLVLNPDGSPLLDINVDAVNADAASELQRLMTSPLEEVESQPNSQAIVAFAKKLFAGLVTKVDGNKLQITLARPSDLDQLPPLLAVQGNAKESETREHVPERLLVGLQRARETIDATPKDRSNESGQPTLSWRVQVMYFLEFGPLVEKFALDEPWDSPHNKSLLSDRDAVVAANLLRTEHSEGEGTTTWKMVPGWAGGVVLVEGGPGSSVPWTKPDLLPISADDPLAQFGKEPQGGYRVVFVDGRVERIAAASLARLLKPPMKHGNSVQSLAIERDGTLLASAGSDNTILLWDLGNSKQVAAFEGHTDAVQCLAFAPDGNTLASGSGDKTIKLWNVANGKIQRSLEGHTSDVHSVTFHPLGNGLASGSWDGTTRLWNRSTGKNTATYEKEYGGVSVVAFSADGRILASAGGGDFNVLIRNVATGKTIATLQGHEATVLALSFSPDGSRVASSDYRGAVKVWNVKSQTLDANLQGHEREVPTVLFVRDGKGLLTAGSDQTIRLWNLATTKADHTFQNDEPITAVAIHPSQKMVFFGGGYSGLIKTWELPAEPRP